MLKFKEVLVSALLGLAGRLLAHVLVWVKERRVFDHALELAKAHVERLASDETLDGAAKREAAKAAVVADLKDGAKFLKDSVLNLVIELAYTAYKAQMGAKK